MHPSLLIGALALSTSLSTLAATCTDLGTAPVLGASFESPGAVDPSVPGTGTSCFGFSLAAASSIAITGTDNVVAGWFGPQAVPFINLNASIDQLVLTGATGATISPTRIEVLSTTLQTPNALVPYDIGHLWSFVALGAGPYQMTLTTGGLASYQLGLDVAVASVPEPHAAALLLAGLLLVGTQLRRRS
jgi:hypothetical protein